MTLTGLPAPEAILFDLDGTLVDTVGRRVEAWQRAFAEAGIPTFGVDVPLYMGSDGRWLAGEVARAAGRTLGEDAAEWLDHRSGEIFSHLNREPRPLPGVTDLLEALDAAGRRWAVATSSRPEQVRASIAALGLGHEPTVTDGSHVARAKPAPDLLLAAADQLGVAPTGTWYVGDSTWDMLAARAAGMTALGVATGALDGTRLREAGAHVAFVDARGLRDAMAGAGLVARARPDREDGPGQ